MCRYSENRRPDKRTAYLDVELPDEGASTSSYKSLRNWLRIQTHCASGEPVTIEIMCYPEELQDMMDVAVLKIRHIRETTLEVLREEKRKQEEIWKSSEQKATSAKPARP